MLHIIKKLLNGKKIVAFALSLLLLLATPGPGPARAEENTEPQPEITEAYRADTKNDDYRQVPTFGGYPIVVKGKNFQGGLRLFIGEVEAEEVQVKDSTEIGATAPRGTEGRKEIKVVNPDGQQATLLSSAEKTLLYRQSQPQIYTVEPAGGSTFGGTLVTIKGQEFDDVDIQVEMGRGFAKVKQVTDHNTLEIETPPGYAGLSPIKIINPDGGTCTAEDSYEYVITPTVSSITPNFGKISGGEEVVIIGTNFPEDVGVKIHGRDATIMEGHSAEQLTIKTPRGQLGPVDVQIYNKDNELISVTIPNGFIYVEEPSKPEIDTITPNVGSVDGGDTILIEGSDFRSGEDPTRVLIGGTDCTEVKVLTTKTIEAKTPPGKAGWHPVEVINPDEGTAKINYGFQYKIPDKLLLITGVTPNRGPIDEQRTIYITGANFLNPDEKPNDVEEVEVTIGGNPSKEPAIIDAETIKAITPLGGKLGPQMVQVTITRELKDENNGSITVKESVNLDGGYIYEPPVKKLIIKRVINPDTGTAEGPLAGGVPVYIDGYYFEARGEELPEVYFGDRAAEVLGIDIAADFEIESDSNLDPPADNDQGDEVEAPLMRIKALIPPADTPGTVPVRVLNPPVPEGETRSEGILEKGFNYRGNVMHLEAVTPNYGPIGGGTVIEIAGKNFNWSQSKRIREEKTRVFIGPEEAELIAIEISEHGLDTIWALTPSGTAGLQDIRVINPFGEVFLPAAFFYDDKLSQPYIEAVQPRFASSEGGALLTLTATGVFSGAKVYVGPNQATEVDVTNLLDDSGNIVRDENGQPKKKITCQIPAGRPGPAPIRITNTDGGEATVEGRFVYLSAPEITAVTPAAGTVDGGTWILLTGEGFLDKDTVSRYVEDADDDLEGPKVIFTAPDYPDFEEEASSLVYISPTEIAVQTPESPDLTKNSWADIELINPDAGLVYDDDESTGRAFKANGYEYRVPDTSPEIESLDPELGPVSGGTKVTITGANFRKDATVYFKWKQAAKVTWINHETLEVITPEAPREWVDEEGGVDVIVINTKDKGQSQPGKYRYVYPRSRPEIHSLMPNQGSVDGGTLVTIRGYDFGNVEPSNGEDAGETGNNEGEKGSSPENGVDSEDANNEQGDMNGNDNGEAGGNGDENKNDEGNEGEEGNKNGDPDHGGDGNDPDKGEENNGSKPAPKISRPTVYFGSEKADIDELSDGRTVLRVRTPAHEPGPVDVRIVNPDSAEVTVKNAFTYRYTTTDPKITGIEPKQGRSSGGTPVVISGSGFDRGAKVYFNEQPALVDSVKSSDTRLLVYSPPGKPEHKVDITVLNPDGASDTWIQAFEYIRDPRLQPRITQIIPNRGSITGGTKVDIWGINLMHSPKQPITVLFGHEPVNVIDFAPDSDPDRADQNYVQYVQIESPPAEKTGPVDVSVINPDGGVFTIPGGFTYTDPAETIFIDGIVPSRGPYLETIPAQINGGGFLAGAKVYLGGQEMAGPEVINNGQAITFTIPAAPVKASDFSVDVVVINPNGATARLENGFTYVAEPKSSPQIERVIPASGRTTGGTPVEVLGQGFGQKAEGEGSDLGPALFFGSRLVPWSAFISQQQISAVTPPGSAGAVNVTVINPDGAMDKLISGFIYEDRPGPHISSIDPNSGPSSGGTEVKITGAQFDEGIKVFFGGAQAPAVDRKSSTELVAITPEGDLGPVDVTVTNPDGSTYTLPDAFTYIGAPKPPAELEATAVSANTIELRWPASVGAESFEIYGGESGRKLEFIAATSGKIYGAVEPETGESGILYYYVRDLKPDTRYYFSIRAVNIDGVSGQTLTASARTLKRAYSEPEFVPQATDFIVAGAGSDSIVITIPAHVLRDTRVRLDLDRPEYAHTRRFTIMMPAAEVDRRGTIYLDAPRLKFELRPQALNTAEVRNLSRREREQASVLLTVAEARGAEAAALYRHLPSGWVAATPIYHVSAELHNSGQKKELAWLGEEVILTAPFDSSWDFSTTMTLHYFEPVVNGWLRGGRFNTWSANAILDRPGFWLVLSPK